MYNIRPRDRDEALAWARRQLAFEQVIEALERAPAPVATLPEARAVRAADCGWRRRARRAWRALLSG